MQINLDLNLNLNSKQVELQSTFLLLLSKCAIVQVINLKLNYEFTITSFFIEFKTFVFILSYNLGKIVFFDLSSFHTKSHGIKF